MSAQPISASESAVRAAVERLSRVSPGAYQVVSCYLKLEPRDKTRGKYLIKIKNRIREALAALQRQDLERAIRAQVAADLERVHVALEEEFGTILVAACDRTSARFFEVTAYDAVELPSLTAEATRPGKFHGERQAKRGNMLAGRFGSDTTRRWRTASSRSTRSVRSPGWWSPASAWTRRRCCRTCTRTFTTS